EKKATVAHCTLEKVDYHSNSPIKNGFKVSAEENCAEKDLVQSDQKLSKDIPSCPVNIINGTNPKFVLLKNLETYLNFNDIQHQEEKGELKKSLLELKNFFTKNLEDLYNDFKGGLNVAKSEAINDMKKKLSNLETELETAKEKTNEQLNKIKVNATSTLSDIEKECVELIKKCKIEHVNINKKLQNECIKVFNFKDDLINSEKQFSAESEALRTRLYSLETFASQTKSKLIDHSNKVNNLENFSFEKENLDLAILEEKVEDLTKQLNLKRKRIEEDVDLLNTLERRILKKNRVDILQASNFLREGVKFTFLTAISIASAVFLS
ncbi:hypothetical protein HDU92_004365, partial [Lobulomyces angularis]